MDLNSKIDLNSGCCLQPILSIYSVYRKQMSQSLLYIKVVQFTASKE